MSNEAHYKYFKSDAATKDAMAAEYNGTIAAKRDEALNSLTASTGAVAWQTRSSWGGADTVARLVFPADHPHKEDPALMVETVWFEGKKHIAVRGKMNRKAGVKFNEAIDGINATLKDLPPYRDWLVDKLGIMVCGLGGPHPGGRGTSMISTYGGNCGDVLVFAVPLDGFDKIEVPESLAEISYGTFYDMTHAEAK